MNPINQTFIKNDLFSQIYDPNMVSQSTIRFARLSFEPRLFHPEYENPTEKLKRENELLISVINYQFPIMKLLKETKAKSDASKDKAHQKVKIGSKLNENEWRFGNIRHENDYIFGKLAKITPKQEVILDEANQGFKETEHNLIFISNFLIDLKTHILAYEVKKDIGSISPTKLIKDLFNAYHDGKEKIDFKPISDRRKLTDRIKNFKQISSVRVILKLPNPHSTKLSDKFYNAMKQWNAKSTEIVLKSDKPLNLKGNAGLLISALSLAEEGHGSVSLKNETERNGEIVTEQIQSVNFPLFKKLILPLDDKLKIESFKQKITEVEESLSDGGEK
jgi:hypothetical protein